MGLELWVGLAQFQLAHCRLVELLQLVERLRGTYQMERLSQPFAVLSGQTLLRFDLVLGALDLGLTPALKQIAATEREAAQKQKLIDAENRRIDALKRTVNGIDPLTKKLADLEARERALNELHKIGEYNAVRYNEALAKIGTRVSAAAW